MCFLVRTVEATGAAALSTASFAILANTFPDNVATVFVSSVECFDLSTANELHASRRERPNKYPEESSCHFKLDFLLRIIPVQLMKTICGLTPCMIITITDLQYCHISADQSDYDDVRVSCFRDR